jgi:hypothetical protein
MRSICFFLLLVSFGLLLPVSIGTSSDQRQKEDVGGMRKRAVEEGQYWLSCNNGKVLPEEELTRLQNVAVRKDSQELLQNLLKRVEPECPTITSRKAVQVELAVDLLISNKGELIATRIVKGHPLFNASARHAICQWQFKPFYYEQKPVAVVGTVVIMFKYDRIRLSGTVQITTAGLFLFAHAGGTWQQNNGLNPVPFPAWGLGEMDIYDGGDIELSNCATGQAPM